MEERMVPQPPTDDGRLPRFEPGQGYLDHSQEMLLALFDDVRSLVKNPDLTGSQRVAAAEVGLACCEQMRDLKYPPKDEDEDRDRPSDYCSDDEEEDEEDDEESGWRWWRPWRRRR